MVLTLAAVAVVGGCKKKVAPPVPPTAPPPPQPKATLTVSPSSLTRGGSASLAWTTSDATSVKIDEIGTVSASGSQSVSPADSTTYHLTATGPGGSAEATARLTVVEPPPPPAPPVATESDAELFARSVKDIYFDYDRYDLRTGDATAVNENAAFFKEHPSIKFTIEGHCDERGSTEYNLALGDNRANAARTALINAGVPASQVKVVSFGKEKPFCTESNEDCWQQNRRDHFVYGQQ
ncbi:MAG: peptidoglycan-associated lipoprotein Pal [Acidobacteriota bacterium]|nr:peptidoglycan-associated lipoprotein Pal [Acidobacteriota bacterium]